MNYKAEIIVKEDPDNFYKILQIEKISRERSTVSMENGSDGLKITIEAKDAVALRASINAVSQVLAVHSRMKGVK